MRKILVILVLALGVFALGAAGAEPSGDCTGSPLPPETAPSGISIQQSGDPATGPASLKICNNGAVIPLRGAVTLSGNPTGQTGYVEADGDTANSSLAPCADGFTRVKVDGGGPHFYEAPDGSFADTKPGTPGSQPANEVPPDIFVTDTVSNCAGPLPPLPVSDS